MAAPMTSHVNVDSIISKLLAVRGSRPGTKVYLTESEIRYLCLQSRAIFLSQPMLLELHVEAPLIVMGDIYGQYYDLLRLFEFRGFPPETNYLFLGNYVDKGKQSIETICLLLAYKIKYPENFFLLRGNHEAASMNYIFGFYDECKRRLNIRLWKTFTDCFNCLPVAAIIDKLIFCCHSGLSPDLQSMEQIRGIRRPTDVPNHGLLCDLLWAYPDHEAVGWGEPDPEGRDGKYSFSFGPEIVSKFLAKHDFDLICRGNDYVEDGYEFFAKEQLVTIFSAPNYLGEYNNAGAMMTIDKTLMCSFPILKPEIASDRRKFFGPKTPHPVADDTEDELFSASAAAAKEQQKRDEESEDEDVSVAIDASATVEEQSENEQSEDEDVSVAIDASTTVEEQSENEQSEDEDVSVAIDASATVEEQSENEQSEDEDRRHYEAYQQALQTGVNVAIKYLKLLLIGPPRTGKTALRRRILGEIINLLSLAIQPSTGAVDAHNVVVKLTKEKMTCLAATISESTWRAVGHGEEKTDLDEELHLLYQFITEGSVGLTSTVSDEPQMMSGQESTKNQRKKRRFNISDLVNRFRKKKKVVISGAAVTKIPSTLSDSEMKEIENTLEAFNTALKSHAGRQQLKVLLEKTILLNMVDTGGQPAFIEMLPMLTIGPALYLIFLRLDQELKQRYKIKYVGEDNEEVSLGESSYTFQEVIFQVLSSITCFGSDTSSSTSVQEKPQITSQQSQAAMLVGTYKDKLEGNPDEVQSKIKQIDRALQEELKEVLDTDLFEADRNLLRFASIDQLMFDVDNMTGSEDEVKKIRKRLEEVILHDFNEVPIPASWLMFGLFLRRMGKHLISLYHCEEISRRLHVNDVREAIGFLHHCIGVLMYYPDVEELKDVVICDPQIVFDSVTELILNTFKFGPVGKAACDKFKQTGQFCFSEIEKLSKTLKSGILPLPQLVKLLEYLYIIARIFWQEESGAEVRDENVVYFMPAVLPSASESELNVSHSPVDPAPLLIRFKSGIVPVGLFCASIASLVAQKKLGWTLMEPQPAGSQCSYALHKNRVTFRVNRCNSSYDVALISKPKRYEVHTTLVRSSSARPSHEICKHVLETVCQTLDHVISKMKHKQYLAQSASNSHTRCPYELGFQCPLHPNKDHMAVFRPYCKQVEPSLSAADKWFNYFESGNTTLLCLDENVVVHLTNSQSHNTSAGDSLQCHSEEDSLAAPHAGSDQMYSLWMGPPQVDLYIHAVLSIANAPLTYLNVTTSLKTLVDWHKLGVMLEIEKSTLDSIRIDYDRWGTARQRSEMVDVWLRSDTQASWSKLCRALESMNESVLSRQIRSKYCHHHN